jgi:CRP-like cAMP-binding protein
MRRVKVLSQLTDEQLVRFAGFMEQLPVKQWTHLVHQGAPASAMYLILDGEMRVRIMAGDHETILATLSAGDCFGEMSLFDDAPRSADVIANKDGTLLKISMEAFHRLVDQAPDIAAPFLAGLGKTLAGRVRADNKRLKDSVIQSLSY